MRTALDINILSALWSNQPSASTLAQRLGDARLEGALLLSPVVYAELLAYSSGTEAFINDFLSNTGVTIDFDLQQAVWVEAGRRFASYSNRRRQSSLSSTPQRKRLLADFLIGAHALLQADRLMTLDPARYQQDFPELRLALVDG